MPVAECVKRITYREYLAWLAWFEIDKDRPSKDNWYSMQIAYEVSRTQHYENPPVLTDFALSSKEGEKITLTWAQKVAAMAEAAKSRWAAYIARAKVVKRDDSGLSDNKTSR